MTIVVIPSFECNYRCKYCYLGNETKIMSRKMDVDFVCSFLSQLVRLMEGVNKKVSLIWHGGEPLLWGIDNYRRVFEFVKEELTGVEVKNSIQSNISLVDNEYVGLFKEYDVKLGFSLDGPKELNDSQRVYENGDGTFDTIIDKLTLCREMGLNVGCVTVFSRRHLGMVGELYQFMNDMQIGFKMNPLFETGEAVGIKDEFGINAMEYADAMIELFDLCMEQSDNAIVEDNLLEMASAVATGVTKHCLFGRNCQDHFLAIAPTGDVMPCGRFCDNDLLQYSYGNLHRETLAEILPRIKQTETCKRAEYIAHSDCTKCKWYHICHGGCLHDGFLASGDFRHKTFLCPAYKKIFAHIEKRLHEKGMV